MQPPRLSPKIRPGGETTSLLIIRKKTHLMVIGHGLRWCFGQGTVNIFSPMRSIILRVALFRVAGVKFFVTLCPIHKVLNIGCLARARLFPRFQTMNCMCHGRRCIICPVAHFLAKRGVTAASSGGDMQIVWHACIFWKVVGTTWASARDVRWVRTGVQVVRYGTGTAPLQYKCTIRSSGASQRYSVPTVPISRMDIALHSSLFPGHKYGGYAVPVRRT